MRHPDAVSSPLRRIGFCLAALGFTLSALVHVASLLGVAVGGAWVLHLGVMALASPLVVHANACRRRVVDQLPALFEDAPPWGRRALQLVFLDFVLEFGAMLLDAHGAEPGRGAGMTLHELRMFSAGWMTFYATGALAWWPRGAARRPRATAS